MHHTQHGWYLRPQRNTARSSVLLCKCWPADTRKEAATAAALIVVPHVMIQLSVADICVHMPAGLAHTVHTAASTPANLNYMHSDTTAPEAA